MGVLAFQGACLTFMGIADQGWWRLFMLFPVGVAVSQILLWRQRDRMRAEHAAYVAQLATLTMTGRSGWSETPAAGPFQGTYH